MPTNTFTSEAALVSAARRGCPSAWKALVERHDAVIAAVCRAHRLSAHDLDDVRQITWMRAAEHLGNLQQPERVGAWLATTARRECLRVIRHAKRVSPCEVELLERRPDPTATAHDRVVAEERRRAVRAAVTALGGRERALLELLYSESEPSYAEIGRSLEMPVGSIGPTRGRVLERLRGEPPVAQLAAA